MKCLSLWQPWATLLVHGLKRCETRSWAMRHRGPLLIHAAKKQEPEVLKLCLQEPFRSALLTAGVRTISDLPFGAIIGQVDIIACFNTCLVHHSAEAEPQVIKRYGGHELHVNATERAFGDYSVNRFVFLTRNAQAFPKPIDYRGAQGLFDVNEEVLDRPAPAPVSPPRPSWAPPPDLFNGH